MPTSNEVFINRFEIRKTIHGRLRSGKEFRCFIEEVHADYIVTSSLKTKIEGKKEMTEELGLSQNMRMDAIDYFYIVS